MIKKIISKHIVKKIERLESFYLKKIITLQVELLKEPQCYDEVPRHELNKIKLEEFRNILKGIREVKLELTD